MEKMLSFARKFVNLLIAKVGRERVHVETLAGFLGYADPKTARSQVARDNIRLRWLIDEPDGYVVGERGKGSSSGGASVLTAPALIKPDVPFSGIRLTRILSVAGMRKVQLSIVHNRRRPRSCTRWA
jgi:hypothetical protein